MDGGDIGEKYRISELAFCGIAACPRDHHAIFCGDTEVDAGKRKRVKVGGSEDAVGKFEALQLFFMLLLRDVVGFLQCLMKFGGRDANVVSEHVGNKRGIDNGAILVGNSRAAAYIGAVGANACQ